MKTAVIYARYSSDSQTEQSIEGQLRVCNDYAEKNNILIVDTYIDRAMTGTNDNRLSFQKMLKDSNKRAWNIVLVYKLDRFSRNKYEMAMHRKMLRDNGIKIVSAMENIPDTPEGIILESLLEGMAEYYSAELSQKVRRGMNETRRKGNFTGGFHLYGFNVKDKKVIIDEEKANVIRFIYEQYAQGTIVKDIIAALNEKGIKNKGKPFARNTVYNILKNEKYAGIYHYGEEVFTNIYPRIVPEPIFKIVQDKIQSNKYGKRSIETVYLLREKIKCGYCGQSICAETGTSKNGQVKRYYKCLGRKRGSNCKKSMIRKDTIEQLVISTTLKVFDDPKLLSSIADKILEVNYKRMQDQTIINILLKEKRNIEKSIDNLVSALEKGIVTNSTKRRLEELESRLEEVNTKIIIEQSKTQIHLSKEDILSYIKEALTKEPQHMITLLINHIVLYDDKIDIFYNYTNSTSPDDNHPGFLFYSNTTLISLPKQNSSIPKIQKLEIKLYF